MKIIASLIMTLALATSAVAGPADYSKDSKDKTPIGPAPEPACFGPGFDVGVFGGGFLPRHNNGGYGKSALGGGVEAEYFFNQYVGIQLSYGAYATTSTQHVISGDVIARLPIQSICLAPYIMVGGGCHVDGTNLGQYHAGVGLEYKIPHMNKMSIFTDGAYYWHGSGPFSSSDHEREFTLVRLGLKFDL